VFRSRLVTFVALGAALLVLLGSAGVVLAGPPTYATYYYGYNPGYYSTIGASAVPYPVLPPRAVAKSPSHLWVVPVQTPAVIETRPAVPVPELATANELLVTVTRPETKPVYVDIRGPNGEVRSFALAGGRESIQTRPIIVRAGEKLTLNFVMAGPTTGTPKQ